MPLDDNTLLVTFLGDINERSSSTLRFVQTFLAREEASISLQFLGSEVVEFTFFELWLSTDIGGFGVDPVQFSVCGFVDFFTKIFKFSQASCKVPVFSQMLEPANNLVLVYCNFSGSLQKLRSQMLCLLAHRMTLEGLVFLTDCLAKLERGWTSSFTFGHHGTPFQTPDVQVLQTTSVDCIQFPLMRDLSSRLLMSS
ncbi:hypothetical protein Tco_0343749 [Tanacetum coccineum]